MEIIKFLNKNRCGMKSCLFCFFLGNSTKNIKQWTKLFLQKEDVKAAKEKLQEAENNIKLKTNALENKGKELVVAKKKNKRA